MQDEMDYVQIGPWRLLKCTYRSIPTKDEFEKDPRFYVILTNKGQLLTAYPEYPPEDYLYAEPNWRSPGGGRVYEHEVIALMPLDVPLAIVTAALNRSQNRNKAFRRIYGP